MVSHEIILSGVIRSAVAFDDVLLRQVQILKKFSGLLFLPGDVTLVTIVTILSRAGGIKE